MNRFVPFKVLALLLVGAAFAPGLFAQEGSPDGADSGDPILDALKERETMEASGATEEAPTSEEDKELIEKNLEKTARTYDRILERADTNTSTLEKRIANLEGLIEETRPKLEGSRAALRTLDVDFTNRLFYMKQQKDQGQLDEATFEKLAKEEEEAKESRRQQLQSDVVFYQEELQRYQKLLTDLRSELRLKQAKVAARNRTASGGSAAEKKAVKRPHSEVILEGLSARLERLSGYHTKRIGAPLASPQDFSALER